MQLQRKYLISTGLLIAGALISISLYTLALHLERERVESRFHRESANRVMALGTVFDDNLHAVRSVESFYRASMFVDRFEFGLFLEHLFRHFHGLQSIAWAPRVSGPERRILGNEARREGIEGFGIYDRDMNGARSEAPMRDEYFPVWYIEPYEGNRELLGLDLLADAVYGRYLAEALKSFDVVASEPAGLSGDWVSHDILMLAPVFKTQASGVQSPLGFIAGFLRIRDLAEVGLSHIKPGGIDIYIYDVTSSEEGKLVFFHPSRLREGRPHLPAGLASIEQGMHYSETMGMANRQWRYVCVPTEHFLLHEKTGRPLIMLFGGLLLTCAGVGYYQIRRSAYERTRESLREKEVLLKEIHHRVKNNMAIISALQGLQLRHVESTDAKDMFRESMNRIRSMALVHEKLYESHSLARVDVQDYVQSLVLSLVQSFGKDTVCDIEVRTRGISMGLDALIPCGLIITELVMNSLKHAFEGEKCGSIVIRLDAEDDKRTLIISDDGRGMPEDIDVETSDTLGLQIVNSLVVQLEGEVRVSRDGGTAFTITFMEHEGSAEEV
jgi:two-component sensor histidine kinase